MASVPADVSSSGLVNGPDVATKGLLGFVLPLFLTGLVACLKDGWRPFVGEPCRVGSILRRNAWLFQPVTLLWVPWRTGPTCCRSRLSGSGGNRPCGLDLVLDRDNLQLSASSTLTTTGGPIYLYGLCIFASSFRVGFLPRRWYRRTPGPVPRRRAARPVFALICFCGTLAFYTLAAVRAAVTYRCSPSCPSPDCSFSFVLLPPGRRCHPWAARLASIRDAGVGSGPGSG